MKKKTPKAPRKLSVAMRMALKDFAKAIKNPKMGIYMGNWHTSGIKPGICYVCFAGASMHYRHNLPLNVVRDFTHFGKAWSNVFLALNHAREGCVGMALMRMKQRSPICTDDAGGVNSYVTEYEDGPKEFRKGMFKVVKWLEKRKL